MTGACTTALRIRADHPALPGHFPGHPVVPGVVLLERVAAALRAWRGEGVARVDAKFLQPLRPEEDAVIDLRADAGRIWFEIRRVDGEPLARGSVRTPGGSFGMQGSGGRA